jgi:hypothetical protein
MHSNSCCRKLSDLDTAYLLHRYCIVAQHRVSCRWSTPQRKIEKLGRRALQKPEGGHRNVKRSAALCVRSLEVEPVSYTDSARQRAILSGSSYRLKVNPHRSELLFSIAASFMALARRLRMRQWTICLRARTRPSSSKLKGSQFGLRSTKHRLGGTGYGQRSPSNFANSDMAAPRRGMKELTGALTLRRAAAFGKAKAAVESPRCCSLLLDTLRWLGKWRLRFYGHRPIERFAADILARRTKRTMKKAKKIRRLDTQQRHKLRIAAKKLRYGSDFFGRLFAGGTAKKRLTSFKARLTDLQDRLGALNDIKVHQKLAPKPAVGKPSCRVRPWTERDRAASKRCGQRCPEILACPTILDLSRNKGRHENINASCARGHVRKVAIRSVNWARTSCTYAVAKSGGTSSAQTRNSNKVPGPNVWVRGTSAASRPCAMRIRPIRGALLRGSKAYQRSPR